MKHLYKITLLLLLAILPTTAIAYDFEVDGIYYNINGTEATVTRASSSNVYTGDIVIPASVIFNSTTYSVTSIGDYAFWDYPDLTSITISEGVSTIGDCAFEHCYSLASITMPSSVISIGASAFEDCTSLTSITIPENVTSIGSSAFSNCFGLTSITFPSSVTSIGDWVFQGTDLTSISVNSNNTVYDSRDNCNAIIKKSNNELIFGCKNTVIPSSVTSIGSSAFHNCFGLTSITIPSSVTTIGDDAFTGTGLTSITIPSSVTTIGNMAFAFCRRLSAITISEGVTSIDDYAFDYCSSLTSITIPTSVTSIGANVFHSCSNLLIVFITGNSEWQAGALPEGIKILHIDGEVTGVKGMKVNPEKIYSYATTPPVCDENSFTGYDAELHVPAASMAAYFTAPYWCNFTNIIGDAVMVTGLTLDQDNIKMEIDSQLTLTATIMPVNAMNQTVTWTSTNWDVATVNNGVVTAVKPGECNIVATCGDKQAVCHVIVVEHLIYITLDEHEARLLPNHLMILTPTVTPVATDLVVTSSSPAVAAARMAGNKIQVMGITEGTTTIYVNSADGYAFSDSCLVEVYTELGDVNCDGFVNISDVTHLIDYLLSGDVPNFKPYNADVSGDGNVTIKDVTGLIDMLLSGDSRLKKSECLGNPMPIQSIRLIRGLPMPSSPIEPYRGEKDAKS